MNDISKVIIPVFVLAVIFYAFYKNDHLIIIKQEDLIK